MVTSRPRLHRPYAAKILTGAALGSIPVIRQAAAATEGNWQPVAFCERMAALFLFLLVLPVLAGCALLTCLLSRRSPLIAHRRVGWQGSTLWMIKLRTMWSADLPLGGGWIERIDDEHGPELKSAA